MGRPVAKPMSSKPKFACILNPLKSVWKNLYQNIMRTILHEKKGQFIAALQFGSHIYSYASSYENSWSESSGGQGMGKIGEFRRGQKSETNQRWSMKQRRRAPQVHFASLMDIMSSEKCWIGGKATKIQRSSCTPRWYCKRRLRVLRSIHWTRIFSISNDSS